MVPFLGGASGWQASLLAGAAKTFWMPEQRSTFASDVDALFYGVLWICVFFFLLIVAMAAFFIVKYRRTDARPRAEKSSHHNTTLEVVWSVVPLIIVLWIFVVGFRGFMDLRVAPQGAYEIGVTAEKWNWTFTYPNGYEDSNLHVPLGKPVKLIMSSRDVIHSFFVPDFRVKFDIVPGRYSTVWFEATQTGQSPIYCTEYCGTSHSNMLATAIVHEPGEFDSWLAAAANWMEGLSPTEAGEILYTKKGCVQCHSTDGSVGVGPSFRGSFGNTRAFADGSSTVMDENYIRESILNPTAKVVVGFDPVMPTFQGRFDDDELAATIAYIKSLK
ncbi:MAG: cytochrome c oxidase subunit 2 [Gemmatimonadota bacterium]|nr:MAG: cytochrome c oxidase subunit 2 [Gemmatimonadota bacterium]